MTDKKIEVKGDISFQPMPHIMQIYENGDIKRPLVTIDLDGTVIIHQKNKENEAAKVFWSAVQNHLKMDPLLASVGELRSIKGKFAVNKDTIQIALDLLKLKLIESRVEPENLESVNNATEFIQQFNLEAGENTSD